MYKSPQKPRANIPLPTIFTTAALTWIVGNEQISHNIPAHDQKSLVLAVGLIMTNIAAAYLSTDVLKWATQPKHYEWVRAAMEHRDMSPKTAQTLTRYGLSTAAGLAFLAASQLALKSGIEAAKAFGLVSPPPVTETAPAAATPAPRP